jgi:3-hydroxyisobutyrate dehydrogenase
MSSGSSFVHETEGQLILNGSYDVAFTMDLALKDLGFALGFGREYERAARPRGRWCSRPS